MRKLTNLLLIIVLVTSGCKKEGDVLTTTNTTTVAQDKQNISNSFASMENCVEYLKNGYGMEALKKFLDLDEGEISSEDWIEDMIEKMDDLLDLDAIEDDNKFDFNGNTGTYTWYESSQSWSKVSTPNNKIIINFPSKQWTASNNDAVFTLHSYSDVAVFYDGEYIFAPTDIYADLYVSGTKVFDITGDYSYDIGNPTPIPINISTILTFNPLTITITGERITSTEFEADISIADNNGCLTTIHGDVSLTHDDYENLEETDIIEINTVLTHNNLKISGYMNGDLLAYDDPSNSQIHAMTDVDVLYLNSKIGELILQDNSGGDTKVYIIYTDGSSEDVETYYDPFLTNIEQILFPLIGDWD